MTGGTVQANIGSVFWGGLRHEFRCQFAINSYIEMQLMPRRGRAFSKLGRTHSSQACVDPCRKHGGHRLGVCSCRRTPCKLQF